MSGILYNRFMSLKRLLLSVEDYLELEADLPEKHEFAADELFTMAGGTENYNRIAVNIVGHLWTAARGGPCRVFTSDMKVRVSNDVFYCPDVMVVCGR